LPEIRPAQHTAHECAVVRESCLVGCKKVDHRSRRKVLERVRQQLKDDDGDNEDLDARLKALEKRLAAKQAERDRYIKLYAQGHITERELEIYLADLKNQIDNVRMLIEATEVDLSQSARVLRLPIQPSPGSTCSGSAPRRLRRTPRKPSISASNSSGC
jgi:predicted RNase H-like nuclease (RuvC/YqgF family)